MAIRTRKKQHTTRLWLLVALLIVICAVIFLLPTSPTVQAEEGDATEQAAQDETATTTLVKEGMQAPDFTVEMFDGSTQTLSSLKGKVVLVNFWATWCPPCREELKRVQQDLVERFAGEEFVFIPISRGEERETVAAFREQMGYTFAMGLDPERKIYDLFASNFIPRNFLIDKEGKVLVASVGYEPEEFDALIAKIEEELKK
ncbi:MAG: TlpA family protein disulfide reductase [Alistipes sp.]|nr:TlpA family protein disulfide reductase [Alistipes sp.]MBQ8580910.1 TlpA family protein disulfide reductase [Alistipes sp.]